MGCYSSTLTTEFEEESKDDEKEEIPFHDTKEDDENTTLINMILLGVGNCGETTLYKQFRSMRTTGYTQQEKNQFKSQIIVQLIETLKTLIEYCQELYEEDPIQYAQYKFNKHIEENVLFIQSLKSDNIILTSDTVTRIKSMWNNPIIQKIFTMRNEICVPDSSKYFFYQIDRIVKENYIPIYEDVLMVRHRTVGVQELKYSYHGKKWLVRDVGGEKGARSQWIHFFDKLKVVIFVISLSCYDEISFGTGENSMEETIMVYEEQLNKKFLNELQFILVFNKSDIFATKIKRVPITVCPAFEDYNGRPDDAVESIEFIKNHFKNLTKDQNRQHEVVQFQICGTNKNKVKNLLEEIELLATSHF